MIKRFSTHTDRAQKISRNYQVHNTDQRCVYGKEYIMGKFNAQVYISNVFICGKFNGISMEYLIPE